MLSIAEASAQRLSVTFENIAGIAALPTTVSYAVQCMATGTLLQAFTPATPANPTIITLGAAINAIQDDRNATEARRLVIKANEGLADALTAQYDYTVINLAVIA